MRSPVSVHSVQRWRLFRFGLGLQIVFAIFVALGNPAPAAAFFQVCNNTKSDITIAAAEMWDTDAGRQLLVEGFYVIRAGGCTMPDGDSVAGHTLFLVGWENQDHDVGWTGEFKFCVADNAKAQFQYRNAQAIAPCRAGQHADGFLGGQRERE